jgi:superfamily II DNA or RNA helicase
MSRKQRGSVLAELDALVLAMPVSWKGTLQQYAGRLHREHSGKADVRIIDFVDTGHPALLRMWQRRQRGYRAMGYRVSSADSSNEMVYRRTGVEVD